MNEQVLDLTGCDLRERAQEGVDMPLLDPAGRPTRAVLRVRGADCQAYADMLQEHIRRGIAMAPAKKTEKQKNDEFWELQATLVASWSHPGGERIAFDQGDRDGLLCTPANVAGVLERHAWLFEQVSGVARKRANFLPGSSGS